MDHFHYRQGRLYCEDVAIDALVDRVGTPAYIYSRKTLEDHYRRLTEAFAPLHPTVLFSIKSCSNLHLLRALVSWGSGMDVVSGGELYRAQAAGADLSKVAYAGVGKTPAELRQAIEAKVGWINVESEEELTAVERTAQALGTRQSVAIRINPDVRDAATHAKTTTGHKGSKFGIDLEEIPGVFARHGRHPSIDLGSLHFHIGSPIYSAEPYVRAITRVFQLIDQLAADGFRVHTLDIGGGYMADYGHADRTITTAADYAREIVPRLQPFVDRGGRILMEPGRTIAANAAILVTEVLYRKVNGGRDFVVVDAGMSHLIRPALYDAVHFIWPTRVASELAPAARRIDPDLPGLGVFDVVGPICESSDRFAADRKLPPVVGGDRLAIFSTGAYGMTMSSHYNSVPGVCEVLVDGSTATIIRRRETYEDLVRAERDTSDALAAI